MKNAIQFTLGLFVVGWVTIHTAAAGFTSIRVFGDTLSAGTTNSPLGQYYGDRWSNGRTWVEVLAQMQELPFNLSANTNAYFGNTSSNLPAEVATYTPTGTDTNPLVVIWVNNADLYYPATDPSPTLAKFTNAINLALTNQFKAITNLYAKGVRTLVMPNVVDIASIPQFNTYSTQTNLFRQASTNYNASFALTLNRARTNYPGLNIIMPDFFSLLTNLFAQPASYGVSNALKNGLSIDALTWLVTPGLSNGPGTNYIFWHPFNPTAKVHYIMASTAQQLLSPAQIGQIINLGSSNRLDLVNVPVGQAGQVQMRAELALGNWATNSAFSSTNDTQSIFVPASGPQQFYRVNFPVVWNWP